MSDTMDPAHKPEYSPSRERSDVLTENVTPSNMENVAMHRHRQTKQRTHFLGFLNNDCWEYVLDYLSPREVLSVGLICRQWQSVVQTYLQNVRVRIETTTNFWNDDMQHNSCKYLTLILKADPIFFNRVIDTFGSSVVELVYDARLTNEHILHNLGTECPNIEVIKKLDVSFCTQLTPALLPRAAAARRELRARRPLLMSVKGTNVCTGPEVQYDEVKVTERNKYPH